MLMQEAKCPRCATSIGVCETVNIAAGDGVMQRQYPAIAFVCPKGDCHTILGVAYEPTFQHTQISEAVSKALGTKRL